MSNRDQQIQVRPVASFAVPRPDGSSRLFHFDSPRATWSAPRLDEVRDALSRVEAAQNAGRYVVGFISYEASSAFDDALCSHPAGSLPPAWFAEFEQPTEEDAAGTDFHLGEPVISINKGEYQTVVRRTLEHIRAGDIYQANYTIRAELQFRGKPFDLWSSLLRAVPVPYAAFVDTGSMQILSLSPELFLKREGSIIESRPMKGTAARKPSWVEDEAARIALEQSTKDRAENTMIVDLMRNDLGRVCRIDSIAAPVLCRAYRYPTVHQMISVVRGELREDASLFDIFAATFPPGSVTGAPKIRATEIITDLEPEPRGVYCGTVGIFFPGGDFQCSVAIRTLEIHGGRARLGIGSGIVIESDPDAEWEETHVKSRFVLQRPQEFGLFETFRYEPETGFRNLHDHLRRLRQSCEYFARPFPLGKILIQLRDLKQTLCENPCRVRLELNEEEISLRLIRKDLTWPKEGLVVMISEERLDPEDPRLYHKTTNRQEKYSALEKARGIGADECLFLNTRGELCEGTISNVLVKLDGKWLTPKLSCGLLPGVWREQQLKSSRAEEAIITLQDLARADSIVMGNSVRGEGRVIRMMKT